MSFRDKDIWSERDRPKGSRSLDIADGGCDTGRPSVHDGEVVRQHGQNNLAGSAVPMKQIRANLIEGLGLSAVVVNQLTERAP